MLGRSMAPEEPVIRQARREDAEAIAWIYGQGISERVATFQTRAPLVVERPLSSA
jgi:L-amino acid N-acyltransferase YncA